MASSMASDADAGKQAAAARAAGERGAARRAPGKKESARKPRKKPLSARAGAWMLEHPVIAGALCTVFIAGTAVLVFWFTNFSGLSSSADFVYSKF